MRLEVSAVAGFQGTFRPPSDKSLTHRAYMLGAIASGESVVRKPLTGEDCEATLACVASMGLRYEREADLVRLRPAAEWTHPSGPLDCGNSGTTMRLLAGLVASRPLDVTMVGDASLSRRPMGRIATPLRLMGARVEGDTPPLRIVGGSLKGIEYQSPVASGQIKSCCLLAGLRADGPTTVFEPSLSRDHTERMLRAMGVSLTSFEGGVTVQPTDNLQAFDFTVPGDISSSAFLAVAAAILPEGQLTITDLSVNPSRTGLLDVLTQTEVPYEITGARDELGEPVADVEIRAPKLLRAFKIAGDLVPRLVDEIPVLAVLATQCEGTTTIRDARELRVKESDRIAKMVDGLSRMGANIRAEEDGMTIIGPTPLTGTTIDAAGDHRIAMAFAVAGLVAKGTTQIDGAESIATSFPDFERELWRLALV
ncbi:3-phosphoshikimate 1-carboxyvinyltransferase [bacterium]|nr:MAG: 3-phosphoshikimate 1-carboxyvinyltransferase [bacterium]